MRAQVLQKLLDKQKLNKFGDLIMSENWAELHQLFISGTKADDIITPLEQNDKLLSFTKYMTTVEPNQANLRIMSQLLPHISEEHLPALTQCFRNFALSNAQCQSAIVDMIVRSFFITDATVFADALIAIIQSIPTIHPIVSASINKFFPQTSFSPETQIRYLRSMLQICSYSQDVTVSTLGRAFQHLVAFDCELMLEPAADGSFVLDDDIAQCFTPQLNLFLEFISTNPAELFPLLLQLFDMYLMDLPLTSAAQYIFFFAASFSHELAETFVGFLLAKLIDVNASTRTRSNASLYIASLVVRALYIDDEFSITIVDYVANFANCYAEHVKAETPERCRLDLIAHNVYYFAVQCVAYICCWRWSSWSQTDTDFVERWNLKELLCNNLKAINAIDRNTAELFRSLNIFPMEPEAIVIERIHVWFPFDPCPLEEIARIVQPFYIEWRSDNDTDDIDGMLDRSLNQVCEMRGITLEGML